MIGHPEQLGIGPLLDEAADQAGLGLLEHERAGHGRERIAAVRVGGMPEVVGQQPQLGVAAGLVAEAVEEGGEAVHAAPPLRRRPRGLLRLPSSP